MERLLYCHQYFHKPTDTGGTRSYYIANAMRDSGISVTMITADKNPSEGPLIRRESFDEIEIYWIAAPYNNSMSIGKKLMAFLKYMFVSSYLVLRIRQYDLIYATSTPLTVGIPALVASFIRRKPYVFEVRDLWPEFPIQMGAIRSPIFKRLTRGLERLIYARARSIVALSPGMQEGVLKVRPEAHVHMVPNMSKPKEFKYQKATADQRAQFGLEAETFRAVYFGTMGKANNIPHLVAEAKYARDEGIDLEFVFVGDGAMESVAKAYVEKHQLDNVVFLGRRPMAEVTQIVSICDVSIVSFTGQKVLETNSPNKFFDSLSASKPCLVNMGGWIRDLVEEYDCGCYVNPAIEGDLAQTLQHYKETPELVSRQGANAYELCLEKFDRESLCAEIVSIVRQR